MKTIAIKCNDIARELGLSEEEAAMAVAHKEVNDKEYKALKKEGKGFRPVDLQIIQVPMPSHYDGLDQGSNPLLRVTYMNAVYLNPDGAPSWIDLAPVRDMLETNGVMVRKGQRVFWNKQVLLRALVGEDVEVAAKDFDKRCGADFADLPPALATQIRNGKLRCNLMPFHYSASPRPRAAKGTGWWEVRMDLYRLTDMLDNPPAARADRTFGPRKGNRQRGMLNSVQYGLIGHQETSVEAGQSRSSTIFTGLYYVQWIGFFGDDGKWVDKGSRVILMPTAVVNRARMAYLVHRCQPAVYKADCGGHHILPMDVLEVRTAKPDEDKPATSEAAEEPKPADGEAAEAAAKPATKKLSHGKKGKAGGNGDGRVVTSMKDKLVASGHVKTDPPADGAAS